MVVPEKPYALEEYNKREEPESHGCQWCEFMKNGGCAEPFVSWRKCIATAKEKDHDMAQACLSATRSLQVCVESDENASYYSLLHPTEEKGESEQKGRVAKETR